MRVYKDGRPIESPAVLPFDPSGADEQEFVIVSGNPGKTQRLLTVAQLRFERDHRLPLLLDFHRRLKDSLETYGKGGEEAARIAGPELFYIDNSLKAYAGMLAGLRDPELFDKKVEQQEALRKKVDENPELKEKFGGAWDAIAAAQQTRKEIYDEYALLTSLGFYSRYFTFAKNLYRLHDELKKPDSDRLAEYHSAGLESLYQTLYSTAPISPGVEIVKLGTSLEFLRDRLSPNDPLVKKILQGKTPATRARELIEGTKLGDVDFRKVLGDDDAALAGGSDDPMIALARLIDEPYRAIRKRYEDEIDAVAAANGALIARARFAVGGQQAYPDATFTPRLAFGLVKAYLSDDRKRVSPFTHIDGLFAKATGEDPYALPKRVSRVQKRLDGETPYNLASTDDITGGNSGSPLLDREGRVVGLIFDGNRQSLSNDYLYSEKQARAVSVDVRGILEMLSKVYRATRLLNELKPKN